MGRRLLAFGAALALAAAACSGGGEDVSVDEEDGGGGGGDGTFVAAISAQPDQLDPHQTTAYASFQVLENVYDTLVVPDPDKVGEFLPSLASDWVTSEDGLTWTFTLRDDVTFQDGSTFDSADVVYTFDRIIDEELSNAYKFGDVEDITAPDATTVEFTLNAPSPHLLDDIGNYKGTAILAEGAADDIDLKTEANGTGPFSLDSSGADGITLKRFDDYWGDEPGVETVEYQFVSEPTAAVTGLQTGEIDWTDNVPVQRIDELEGNDVEVGQVASGDYWYMALNFAKPPFDKAEVRQAVNLALDRDAIADAAQFGLAHVNQTAIPEESVWYYDYNPVDRDIEEAKRLLAEAGEEDIEMGIMVTDEYPETVEAAQVISANLEDVGITVNIETEEFSTWLDRESAGDFDSFMLGWLGNIDPYGYYHSQHTCEGVNNYQKYCDEQTDELLNQASTEMDQDTRKDLYDQAAKRIVDANSYVYLYNPEVVQAWSTDVSGYTPRSDRAIDFSTVTIGS